MHFLIFFFLLHFLFILGIEPEYVHNETGILPLERPVFVSGMSNSPSLVEKELVAHTVFVKPC
jgi:hypothetical protein